MESESPIEPFECWVEDPVAGRRLFRPLVYAFAHQALPEALFQNHPELEKVFQSESPSSMDLIHYLSKAVVACIGNGTLSHSMSQSDELFDYQIRLMDEVEIKTAETSDCDIRLVRMPKPRAASEAVFAALVRRKGQPHEYMTPSIGSRYITQELSQPSDRAMLCEWDDRGSHSNYGSSPMLSMNQFQERVVGML